MSGCPYSPCHHARISSCLKERVPSDFLGTLSKLLQHSAQQSAAISPGLSTDQLSLWALSLGCFSPRFPPWKAELVQVHLRKAAWDLWLTEMVEDPVDNVVSATRGSALQPKLRAAAEQLRFLQ